MVGTIGLRDALADRRNGLRGLLPLLLVVAMALYGLAPTAVLAPASTDQALGAWTLPDGSDLPICHGFPDDPSGGGSAAVHCLKCLVLGHAVAHALPACAAPVAVVAAGRADWPTPTASSISTAPHHRPGARAPPVLA